MGFQENISSSDNIVWVTTAPVSLENSKASGDTETEQIRIQSGQSILGDNNVKLSGKSN